MTKNQHAAIAGVVGMICGTSFTVTCALIFGPLLGGEYAPTKTDREGNVTTIGLVDAYSSLGAMLRWTSLVFIVTAIFLWWWDKRKPPE